MGKRFVSVFLSILLCVPVNLLVACSDTKPKAPVQITLMHGWGGSAPDHVAMRQIYEDFNEANPDIELLFDMSPDLPVVLEKANNMLALDEIPDIISTNGYRRYVEGAVRKGMALDFSPYMEEDPEFAACISQSTLDTWREEDGSIYTLPDAQEIIGYWYNEDILRQAGVTDDNTPTGNVVPPTTWEDFWEAWNSILQWSEETGAGVLPAEMNLFQSMDLYGAIVASGGEEGMNFMQKKDQKCSRSILENAMEEVEKAYATTTLPLKNDNNIRNLFFEGKTAFYFNGVWANISLSETKNNQSIHYAAFPGPKGESLSYVTSSSGYVVGNTGSDEKKEACVRFIKYMVSDEVQRRIVVDTKQAPSNPQVDVAWIKEQVPVLGNAIETCYVADKHIVKFSTLLDEQIYLALKACFSVPEPNEEDVEKFYSIVSQND